MTAIRKATAADVDAIARLHVVAHRETYAPLFGTTYDAPGLDARRALWARAVAGPGQAFVAAGDDGDIAGFGHHLGPEITTLYLAARWHRRGIGRALLRRLLDAVAAAGFTDAHFAVLGLNRQAIAFYETCGARRTGARIDPHDGTEDFLYTLPIV